MRKETLRKKWDEKEKKTKENNKKIYNNQNEKE